jgi:TetR/AcrR family transcriptional regulator, cholesterol catabolism regulator
VPRVVKHPDIRRAELLDRAAGLFLRHGYDNVSLNDLIADAGVSKGAFYHWFPSKGALIAALAERSAREAFAGVEDAVAGCNGDALARLNAALRAGFDVNMKTGGPEQLAAMVSLLRPDNAHLYGRILAVEEALFLPLLTRLISDGLADGVFDTFDPEGVADMIYGLAARTNSNILDVLQAADESVRGRAVDCLTTRFRLHGLAADRILGLPDGSVATLTRAQVEAMVAALPRNY